MARAREAFAGLRPVLPAMAAVASLGGSLVDMALARWLLRQLGEQPPCLPPFGTWRFPWYLALGFIAGQALVLVERWWPGRGEALQITGHNLLLFFSTLFWVQGLAIVWFFLRRAELPRFAGLLLLGLASTVPLVPGLLKWAGVLDVWFNFRRLPTGEG